MIKKISQIFCKIWIVVIWKRNFVFFNLLFCMFWAISRHKRWNGIFFVNKFAFFWDFVIFCNATAIVIKNCDIFTKINVFIFWMILIFFLYFFCKFHRCFTRRFFFSFVFEAFVPKFSKNLRVKTNLIRVILSFC